MGAGVTSPGSRSQQRLQSPENRMLKIAPISRTLGNMGRVGVPKIPPIPARIAPSWHENFPETETALVSGLNLAGNRTCRSPLTGLRSLHPPGPTWIGQTSRQGQTQIRPTEYSRQGVLLPSPQRLCRGRKLPRHTNLMVAPDKETPRRGSTGMGSRGGRKAGTCVPILYGTKRACNPPRRAGQ